MKSLMASKPRARLVEKCVDGLERRYEGSVFNVAMKEEEEWGRKM